FSRDSSASISNRSFSRWMVRSETRMGDAAFADDLLPRVFGVTTELLLTAKTSLVNRRTIPLLPATVGGPHQTLRTGRAHTSEHALPDSTGKPGSADTRSQSDRHRRRAFRPGRAGQRVCPPQPTVLSLQLWFIRFFNVWVLG